MYFPSKRDAIFGFLVWGSLLIGFVPLLMSILGGEPIAAMITAIVFIALFLLLGWMWQVTGYTITDDELYIVSGPYRKRIALKDITKVKAVRSYLSAPALSFDRFEIHSGRFDMTYVSPQDKDTFIQLLQERCPNITVQKENE